MIVNKGNFMPNLNNYYFSYGVGTSSDVVWSSEEYVRERERQDVIIEQMLQEQAELEDDKRKYPLFFLKKGIV